jgi:ATP-dependent DNA helicase RecQ
LERLEYDNGRNYSSEEYLKLETHYAHKVQQIHIVGEYARKMLQDYQEGLAFVDDYFTLDYNTFLEKHFPDRQAEIKRPLLPRRFRELFGNLSPAQLAVVRDTHSPKIMVTAGPGSGKTRVLAHKVASLLLLEDIRPEQFLMLTFSRAAALEFRERLRTLIKGMVHFLDISTCHSFCFHLLGRKGTLETSETIIGNCLEAIRNGTIPAEKLLVKSVLVVDEFQDISENEFALIRELIGLSGDLRVLVAGDEDQNIYEFRGSATGVMQDFGRIYEAKHYQLSANFRSRQNLVQFANQFMATLRHRAPKDNIYAATAENGFVRLVIYQSRQLVAPLAADVKRLGFSGTTAVLTHTNEEALLVENCLRNNGVAARLILSAEGFCLADLLEIRHFSGLLAEGTDPQTELVPELLWLEAMEKTSALFSKSDKLWLCLAVADKFANAYPLKYLPEWHNYLKEIRFEDFYYPENGMVLVSTMHKAKGKEFDNVFLLLENYPLTDDARRRTVYVALTRAKQNLIIHTNGEGFEGIRVENMETLYDTGAHQPAREISFHLSLRDVYLNAFRNRATANAVIQLQAGQSLTPGHDGRPFIELQTSSPLRYSRTFEEVLNKKLREGYLLTEVAVNFQVYWRDSEAGKEYRVLLPRLRLVCNG